MRFERIGRYDVTTLLGEGGMGQVWQATDTQLNRQVALKILPDAFADDPDRLARFQREARLDFGLSRQAKPGKGESRHEWVKPFIGIQLVEVQPG